MKNVLIIFSAIIILKVLLLFLCRRFGFVFNIKNAISKVSGGHDKVIFMKNKVNIYYINMDKSIERCKYILSNLEKMSFDNFRIAAFDGIKMNDKEINDFVDINKFNKLRGKELAKGEVGCYKSHLLSWQVFLDSDAEFGLICEDDIDFNPIELEKKISLLINKTNRNIWDICSFQLKHSGLPVSIKNIDNDSRIVIYLGHCVEAGCYLINRRCADLFVQNALKMIMPLDYYYNRPFEFNIKFVGIEPRIVHQKFGTSEIGETKSKVKKINQFNIKFYKKLYRFSSSICRVSFNLKQIILLKINLFKIDLFLKKIKNKSK